MSEDSKRLQFNEGEPLTADGLVMEQQFHIRQRELWNKALSGWGIIGDGFQLEFDSTRQIAKASNGTAIGEDGRSLLSDAPLESPIFNPSDNHGFAVVYIKWMSEPRDKIPSIDGENHVWTSWQDRTILRIKPLADETVASEKVQELTRKGRVVVGSLEKLDGKWKSSNKFRQQGPIDSPGGKDAARIANAISVNGFGQRESARRSRNLLFWLGTTATAAMLLASLLWIWVWYSKYFVPPQVPYSVAIEDGKDLQGPIAGETYDQGEYTVVVKDQFGKPIEGIVVEYQVGDRNPKEGNAFVNPVSAVFSRKNVNNPAPDIARIVTNSEGKATPGEIRFAKPKPGEKIPLVITFPETKLASIGRKLVPVSKKCDGIKFIGNFLHDSTKDSAKETLTAIPEVHRPGDTLYLRLQAVNGADPVSMSGLKPTCKLWFRKMRAGESLDKIDELMKKGLEVTTDDLMPRDDVRTTVKDDGANSWVTFELKPNQRGIYKAVITLDGSSTSAELYFLVK